MAQASTKTRPKGLSKSRYCYGLQCEKQQMARLLARLRELAMSVPLG